MPCYEGRQQGGDCKGGRHRAAGGAGLRWHGLQKLWAAIALWNLADNDDTKVAITEAGGIAPLIALARGGTDGQKGSAAGALRRLASNDDSQVAIAEAGGIAPPGAQRHGRAAEGAGLGGAEEARSQC